MTRFATEVLGVLATGHLERKRVNPAVAHELLGHGFAENHDAMPGRPNYVKGKWLLRITEAGRAELYRLKKLGAEPPTAPGPTESA